MNRMKQWTAITFSVIFSVVQPRLTAQDSPYNVKGNSADFSFEKTATPEAFPSDTVEYNISFTNMGPDSATGVTIVDTLPSAVRFLSASQPFSVRPGDPTVVTWEIGTVAPGGSGSVQLTTLTRSGFKEKATIVNRAWISSNEGIPETATATTTNVLPMKLTLSPGPKLIFGNGTDSSTLTARVYSYLGNAVPDGIPVSFTPDKGTIPPEVDTTDTRDGVAQSILISHIVKDMSTVAIINARANFSLTQFASDTTKVVFLLGAYDGTIIDYTGVPVSGATAKIVRISTGNTISNVTTGADGYYSLPIHVKDDYRVILSFTDDSGNPRAIEQMIAVEHPDSGVVVTNLNAVSGWIYNENTDEKIEEAGVPVVISSVEGDTTTLEKGEEGGVSHDTTYTDSTGFYYLANIDPGSYRVSVIYHGVLSYNDGEIGVDLRTPGDYVINANVPLQRDPYYVYKTVDHWSAEENDTLTYTIHYGTIDIATTDAVHVVDYLPKELTLIEDESLFQMSEGVEFVFYDPLMNNEVRFSRDGMGLNEVDSIIFKAMVNGDLSSIDPLSKTGYITNTALVTDRVDTTFSVRDTRSRATTKIILDILRVKKESARRSVEVGDLLTYTVTIKNASDEESVQNLTVMDVLPYGFKYKKGRSYWDSGRIDDPLVDDRSQKVRLTWALDDTLNPGETRRLKYRTIVGLTSRYGENENRVLATAETGEGAPIHSLEARAPVIVRPGMFSNLGLIMGKVYYDLNSNNLHDSGEPTVGGVQIIMEDGTRVITDESGKYSIPNVRSSDHVLRVNPISLPDRTRIILNSADFLGDPRSRLVNVSPGGIAKANFAIERIPEVVPEEEPELREEVGISLSEVTPIKMRQTSLAEDFRMTVFEPWSMYIRLGFPSGEATLRPEIMSELQRIGEFLQWQYTMNVEIIGHTDNVQPQPPSPFSNNMELSKARADEIGRFLDEEMGIFPTRITTRGVGDSQPLADNSTPEGRAINRRVEVRFSTPYKETEEEQLRFNVTLSYADELPLSGVHLVSQLPAGWGYAANSGLINGVPANPSVQSDATISWDLGDWVGETLFDVEFGLTPSDHRKIPTISTLKSHLGYNYPDGSSDQTDALVTNINTRIEEMLFRMILTGTQFDVNLWNLKPAAIVALAALGRFLNWQLALTIITEGFTDSTGTLDWNTELSLNRANSARDYLLTEHNISRDRIETVGYGPQFPVEPNRTVEGRALNRRVEVIVNSDFQQMVTLEVEAEKESLVHQVSFPQPVSDDPSRLKVFTVPAGDTTGLRFFIDLSGMPDVDSVNIVFDLPQDIEIEKDVQTGYRPVRDSWMLPVQRGQQSLIHDFLVAVGPGTRGDRIVQLSVQTYREDEEVYGVTLRRVIIRVE